MNKYYYLIASLSYLTFGNESPIAIDHFMSECKRWVSKSDFKIFEHLDINARHMHDDDPDIVKKWKEFTNGLKEELADIREIKKTHPEEKLHSLLNAIFEEANPLLMEKRYEKIRWDWLERQEFYYFFDINWLIIYLFKLNIIERLTAFNKEKGAQVFDQLCEVISHSGAE